MSYPLAGQVCVSIGTQVMLFWTARYSVAIANDGMDQIAFDGTLRVMGSELPMRATVMAHLPQSGFDRDDAVRSLVNDWIRHLYAS